MSSGCRVVVGVGNNFRGDDGVGLVVAERLRSRVGDDIAIVECEREPTRLLDTWSGATAIVVVDAVDSGEAPGTLHRFDATHSPLPVRVLRSSTHAFGVGETIELARALGDLPDTVIVHGVEGRQFAAGDGLTPEVEAAVEGAVRAVLDDLERLTRKEDEQCTTGR